MGHALFVCIRNAGRSQMAAAFFERAAAGRHEVRSAGSRPAASVHPAVVDAMREVGIDVADRTPRLLTTADAAWADVVVTMGCGDACPYVPGKRYLDWQLDDPGDHDLEAVRVIRDEIARRIDELIPTMQSESHAPAPS